MKKSFRDLKVWQLAVELSMLTYRVTSGFPKHEIYGLSSQMRRAAVSIASNIAEGSARSTRKDFRQFVIMAKGSTCELQTQFTIARRLGYIAVEDCDEADIRAEEVARMLSGLSRFLKAKPPSAQ